MPHAELSRCGTFLAVLLSADSAALAVGKNGDIVRQKCLTGYTVRKKAGKAQLTYLRRCPMQRRTSCGDSWRPWLSCFEAA